MRLQLQGQSRKSKNNVQPVVFKNSFDAFIKIYSNEGLRGLQKGLTPAILREGSKNLFRIGMYDPIMHVMHDPDQGRAPGWKRVLAGSICGVMGAVSCNPFELVKTRLQSAAAGSIAVGHQYAYTGVWHALRTIYTGEGFKGLYRGSLLSMARSIVGSGTNLSAYSMMKEFLLLEHKWKDSLSLDVVCGLSSGIVSCIFMNPIDVVRTRFYNQPYSNGKGELYSSGIDAVRKIINNEGFSAFYKGFFTHFLRIGPHFCLTFVFLGVFRRGVSHFYEYLDARDSFRQFDCDGDGVLDEHEVERVIKTITPSCDEKTIHAYASRILEKADRDHDHVISFEEYLDMEREVQAIYTETNSNKSK